jgi:hypothetical protein
MTDIKHCYTVRAWGAELEFYSGLTLSQVKNGFGDLDQDDGEVLIDRVLVVTDAGTVHEGSFEHPEIKWPGVGVVRPLMLKWYWEIELEGEFDPLKLCFSDSVLVYDEDEYEPEETAPKGYDEPYEV